MGKMQEGAFADSAVKVFAEAKKFSEGIGVDAITLDVFAFSLCAMKDSPIYRYVLLQATEEKFEVVRKQLYDKHILNGTTTTRLFKAKIGDEEYVLDTKIEPVITKAQETAFGPYYQKQQVEVSDLIIGFSRVYEDYFEEVIDDIELGCGIKPLNWTPPFRVPKEMASFLEDLNEKYAYRNFDDECEICEREEETEEMIQILMKKKKRNVIFIGEAGVGKTAIVEKFVWMIVTGRCPKEFRGFHVLSLNVTGIISGTQYRGTAEERFQMLSKYLEETPNVIVFVDEIHLMLGAGQVEGGSLDLGNALKPILARDKVRFIGATTSKEYDKYFSNDPALKRRFETIFVKEPTSEEVFPMITNQIKSLERFHGVSISTKQVKSIIFFAACYNYQTKNPDRTIDLLDKVMVNAKLAGRKKVKQADIEKVFKFNQRTFKNMSDEDKTRLAYHEAGHYIIHRFATKLSDLKVIAVSIVPAKDKGFYGVNVLEPNEDGPIFHDRVYYVQLIAAKYGGRVAEEIYSNSLSSGATSDIAQATQLATNVVMSYGLSDERNNRAYGITPFKETAKTNEMIDEQINKLLDEALDYARRVINEHTSELDRLVKELKKKGILSKKDLDDIF